MSRIAFNGAIRLLFLKLFVKIQNMELKEIIAKNLIELRKYARLTQAELAEKLNYSDKAVSKWERGESLPDIETFKKIADIYGITVDSILSEDFNAKKVMRKKYGLIAGQKTLIAIISALLVWVCATLGYVVCVWCGVPYERASLAFISALPATFIVLLVFGSIWGKPWFNAIFASALLWTLGLFIYMLLKYLVPDFNASFLCFVLPIPIQVVIIVWYGLVFLNYYLKIKRN